MKVGNFTAPSAVNFPTFVPPAPEGRRRGDSPSALSGTIRPIGFSDISGARGVVPTGCQTDAAGPGGAIAAGLFRPLIVEAAPWRPSARRVARTAGLHWP